MKVFNLIAPIEKNNHSGMYVGFFPSVPGAYTQAKTLDDLNIRMKEVLELCLETMSKKERNEIPEFVGTQQISVAV